jgi:hypothetical protein
VSQLSSEKSSVNESLKDSLLSSPLSDKIFGLSVHEVQEEMKKLPQPVKVNVQVTNSKRSSCQQKVFSCTQCMRGAPKKVL